jgi:hypothetical protein
MPLEHYLLLSLADRPPTALAPDPAGGSQGGEVRCLNSNGRWAVRGIARSPLLAWHPAQAGAAQAAAERASKARGRPVEVLSRAYSTWVEGREIQLFTDAFEPALHGHAAQSEGKARRLRTEAEKLAAFCVVVRAASGAADHASFAEVSRAASKALSARFGGGSITSAFAWLAGRAGQEALESVIAGEVELTGPLSIHQVIEAVELAQKAERLRGKG